MSDFRFKIALNVLNHLGRGLYRNFSTIIGEAISNSWDADAKNVHVFYDKKNEILVIKDDGDGMSDNDFQQKFLKVGYTKRQEENKLNHFTKTYKRPYIGRKGIGKLAMLSVSEEIHIISKTYSGEYVGGVINNKKLDEAIEYENTTDEDTGYDLPKFDLKVFEEYMDSHQKGTIIFFKNFFTKLISETQLRKILTLYFRFSLKDKDFNIFVNNKKISYDDIKDLLEKTQFLWATKNFNDPMIEKFENLKEEENIFFENKKIKGFLASVDKPTSLNILGLGERVGVDLFVNGRLRERNIIGRILTSRIAESYIYGQIHLDYIDESNSDPFGASREHVNNSSLEMENFLKDLKKNLKEVIKNWDVYRLKHRKEGDSENKRITPLKRKSFGLFDVIVDEKYSSADKIPEYNTFVKNIRDDASFNFSSYADCYLIENLLRNYIDHEKIPLTSANINQILDTIKKIENAKIKGNVSIKIRSKKYRNGLEYLDMLDLTKNVEKKPGETDDMSLDSKSYKPLRDALMHTGLLTEEAKSRLTSIYNNVSAKVLSYIIKKKESQNKKKNKSKTQ